MKSRWYEFKEDAIQLRKRGLSIGAVERKLGIPRSTLSGWFKNVPLAEKYRKRLHKRWLMALVKARKKASLWHRAQKQQRLEQAKQLAMKTIGNIGSDNPYILELALAILYIGEGKKASDATSLGSSDPLLLQFYLKALTELYDVDRERLRCALFLRADQKATKLKYFWSRKLGLPLKNFTQVNKDKRTIGSKTYPHYKGVCAVSYCDVAIKRKLLAIGEIFFNKYLGS